MTDIIRVAGAQIPVCDSCSEYNKVEILKALDWAKENNVDYLLTPECALSGYGGYYIDNKELIMSQLKEIEDHQKKLGVGIGIGLNIKEDEYAYSQIRHYDKEGNQYAKNDKTLVCEGDWENEIVSSYLGSKPIATFTFPGTDIQFTGLLCNDMWGYESYSFQLPHFAKISSTSLINLMHQQDNLDLVFHATNSYKFHKDNYNKYRVDADILHLYHESHLLWMANHLITNILTVDSCTRWNWDGNLDTIDDYITGSPTGFIDPNGKWLHQCPRSGRQFFYHDMDLNARSNFITQWNERGVELAQPETKLYKR